MPTYYHQRARNMCLEFAVYGCGNPSNFRSAALISFVHLQLLEESMMYSYNAYLLQFLVHSTSVTYRGNATTQSINEATCSWLKCDRKFTEHLAAECDATVYVVNLLYVKPINQQLRFRTRLSSIRHELDLIAKNYLNYFIRAPFDTIRDHKRTSRALDQKKNVLIFWHFERCGKPISNQYIAARWSASTRRGSTHVCRRLAGRLINVYMPTSLQNGNLSLEFLRSASSVVLWFNRTEMSPQTEHVFPATTSKFSFVFVSISAHSCGYFTNTPTNHSLLHNPRIV
jgi:hypothetical protein